MVKPPPLLAPSGRPILVPRELLSGSLKRGNHEEFLRFLQRAPARAQNQNLPGREPALDEGDPKRIQREMSAGEPPESLSTSLAPDEGSLLGRGPADPGELLALFNAGGGFEPAPVPSAAPLPPAAVAEVAQLIERWVRRVALGGDLRRGVARLDIGGGRFAGAELLVTAEAGRVSVELSLPSTVSDPALSERLRARLEQRGYAAEVVVR